MNEYDLFEYLKKNLSIRLNKEYEWYGSEQYTSMTTIELLLKSPYKDDHDTYDYSNYEVIAKAELCE